MPGSKSRLARVMKAQQKGTTAATGAGNAGGKVIKGKGSGGGVMGKGGRKAKGAKTGDGKESGLDKGQKVKVEDGGDEDEGDVEIKDESDETRDDVDEANVNDLED